MLLKIFNGELKDIVLREDERVSIAPKEAIAFVQNRLDNIDEYVLGKNNVAKCFFTDRIVRTSNCYDENIPEGCIFSVEKNGEVYTCMYKDDISEKTCANQAAYKAYSYLLWRYGSNRCYEEWIGDSICNGKRNTVKDTLYNDCTVELNRDDIDTSEFLQIEICPENKHFVRKMMSRYI